MTDTLAVEVVYALPGKAHLVRVRLPVGSTVQQALDVSGLGQRFAEIGPAPRVGIFGKLCKLDTALHDRDRVEIYRPLIADPKEVRRKRAEEGKVTKKGGGDAVPA